MQSDHKQVYNLTAKRTGKNEQMYKDLGNFVFTELSSILKKPKSLIIKLKGIGSWHLRKKRLEIFTSNYSDWEIDEFSSEDSIKFSIERKEQHELFLERLKEYEEYMTIKKELRIKRNEVQVLLKPDTGKDKSD